MTGNRPLQDICSTLVEHIDLGRDRWFTLFKQVASEDLIPLGVTIVNDNFLEHIRVDIREQYVPDAFPYNRVAGDTVEATIIGWQEQVALGFAMEKGYLGEDQLPGYTNALLDVIASDKRRWVVARATFYISGGTEELENAMVIVLAHYLMNDATRSNPVLAMADTIERTGLPFLRALTALAAAVAFGDAATAQQIRSQLKAG